ncbi:MAG: hypothetical protein EP346_09900 [Bacteroidetes bacterium]|nr:MAG: hypothetical protein EP346_09900 [Bacteroidota bacterium]
MKKIMKRVNFSVLASMGAIVFSTLVAVPVLAQEAQPEGRGGEAQLNRMAEELELSDEQRESIGAIFATQQERTRAKMEEVRAIREETKSEIQAVLTKEQLEKWNESRPSRPIRGEYNSERGTRGGRRDSSARSNHHLDRIAEDLELTEEQRTRVEAIMEANRTKMRERREQMREERNAMMREMQEVLTEEQMVEWKKSHGQRAHRGREE